RILLAGDRRFSIRLGGGLIGGRRGGGCVLLALAALLARGGRRRRLRRRGCGGRCVLLVELLLLPLDIVLVEILRNALIEAGHAVGEYRLALARQLLLGIKPVEHVGRIEVSAETARAAGKHARERDEQRGCDQTVRAAYGRSLGQTHSSRPSALRNRRQQGLQCFGARAQARRRLVVGRDLVEPEPGRRSVVGVEGRQREQLARGVTECRRRHRVGLEPLLHVGIGRAVDQQTRGADARQFLLLDADR